MKTGFFDYYHRGLAKGLTPAEAYRWAITEDLYSADGLPLKPGEATADGWCHHPQEAARVHGSTEEIDLQDPRALRLIVVCWVCGQVLRPIEPRKGTTRWVWERTRILTRSEYAAKYAPNDEGIV